MNAIVLSALLLSSSWAVENVTVHIGNGTVLEGATVLVNKGKITSVGQNVKIGKKATRIDGTGKILTPGFIETNSQIGLIEVSAVPSTNDYSLSGTTFAAGFRAIEGFNPFSTRIPLNRNEGVTGMIVSPKGGILSGSGTYAELTGKLATRPKANTPSAMFGSIGTRANKAVGSSRGGMWLALREFIAESRYYQKNKNAINRGLSYPLQFSPVHLTAMTPVLSGKIPLVLTVHRAADILKALEFAKAQNIRLIIQGGSESWLVAKEIQKARVPVLLRPSGQQPWGFEAIASRDDIAAKLRQAGVSVILSAGGWAQNARRIRQEAGTAVAFGMPYNQAMQAITQAPAQAFGLDREVGTIERGKAANLVLWSADPFELSSTVEMLWIRGKMQSLQDRQIALANRYKK